MGGIAINEKNFSEYACSYLLKHTNLNETEERIWILNTSMYYISIKDCVVGYIEPKGDTAIEAAIDAELLPDKPIKYY